MRASSESLRAGLCPCCCHLLEEFFSLLKISLFLASLSSYVVLVWVSLSMFASNFYLLFCVYFIVIANTLVTDLGLASKQCGGIDREFLLILKMYSPKPCCVSVYCVNQNQYGGLASR